MSKIDAILWTLKDGKVHSLTEITEKIPLPHQLAKMAFSFLREFNFIQVNEIEQKAKLHPVMLKFINEIQCIEKEGGSSHKSFESTVGTNEFASLKRGFESI